MFEMAEDGARGQAVCAATRFMPKPLLSRNRTSGVSRSQEFERLSNEPIVVLEDAAVSGVRVDPQRRIWKATRQVVRIARRHHAVVITVGHQDGGPDGSARRGRCRAGSPAPIPSPVGQAVDDTAPQRRVVEEPRNEHQQAGHGAPAHVAPPQAAFNELALVGAV